MTNTALLSLIMDSNLFTPQTVRLSTQVIWSPNIPVARIGLMNRLLLLLPRWTGLALLPSRSRDATGQVDLLVYLLCRPIISALFLFQKRNRCCVRGPKVKLYSKCVSLQNSTTLKIVKHKDQYI